MLCPDHGQTSTPVPPDPVIHVVDDDQATLDLLRLLLKTVGLPVITYSLPSLFTQTFDPNRPCCVILDVRMPESNGVETFTWLRQHARTVPVIFVSGYSDLATVIRVMKLGAVEFFEKPFNKQQLIEAVQFWVRRDTAAYQIWVRYKASLDRLATLSVRERQVLDCVLDGKSNKQTARHLGVSPKAIEVHRAHLMRKMNAGNVVELVTQITGCLRCSGSPVTWPPCLNRAQMDDTASSK
jgi:FixJ family two-component response regulator